MSQYNHDTRVRNSRPNAPVPLSREQHPEMSNLVCSQPGCGKRLTQEEVKLQTGKNGWKTLDKKFCPMHRSN